MRERKKEVYFVGRCEGKPENLIISVKYELLYYMKKKVE